MKITLKNQEKGFTLIELLAVIVILAIIALIATPIVLNIINDAKEESELRSAEFYLKSLELSIAQATLDGKNITDGVYNILENGNLCLSGETTIASCTNPLTVEVKGKAPSSGTISIINGQIGDVLLKLDNNEIVKDEKGELKYKTEETVSKEKTLEEVCTYVSGTAKTAGAKYSCKVDPNKDPYTFYILNYLDKDGNIVTDKDNAVSVNLLMDSNIAAGGIAVKEENSEFSDNWIDIEWINQDDYLSVGGSPENWDNNMNSDKGPITAMNYLQEATKNWTNTNEIEVSTFDECDYYNNCTQHTMGKTYKTYARMPYKTEITPYSESAKNAYLYDNLLAYCTNADVEEIPCEDDEVTDWLGVFDDSITHLTTFQGYWTLSSKTISGSYSTAWYVTYSGSLHEHDTMGGDDISVRPVINLKI